MLNGASCEFWIWALTVGVPGSVTITEGNIPDFDVAVAADSVVTRLVVEDAPAALLDWTDPLEYDAATLLAVLAEAIVWKVDICTLEGSAASEVFAAITDAAIWKAAAGHRHEQSHGSEEAPEAAGEATEAVDAPDVPGTALELETVDTGDAVVSTWFSAPAVTTARELWGVTACWVAAQVPGTVIVCIWVTIDMICLGQR